MKLEDLKQRRAWEDGSNQWYDAMLHGITQTAMVAAVKAGSATVHLVGKLQYELLLLGDFERQAAQVNGRPVYTRSGADQMSPPRL